MREAARLGLPVAVHAENQRTGASARARTAHGIRDYLDSRPVVAEVEAIQRAALLAREAGAKLHIVHISSGRGVAAALEARARGVDVSIETCPHYLFFTEEDVERLGAVAKCAPPLRPAAERDALWAALLRGDVDIVGSRSLAGAARHEARRRISSASGAASPGCSPRWPCCSNAALPAPQRIAAAASPPIPRGDSASPDKGAHRRRHTMPISRWSTWTPHTPCTRESLFQRHGLSPYVGRDVSRRGAAHDRCAARRSSRTARSWASPAAEWSATISCSIWDTRVARTSADHLLHTPDTFVRAPLPGMKKATAIVHVVARARARRSRNTPPSSKPAARWRPPPASASSTCWKAN